MKRVFIVVTVERSAFRRNGEEHGRPYVHERVKS